MGFVPDWFQIRIILELPRVFCTKQMMAEKIESHDWGHDKSCIFRVWGIGALEKNWKHKSSKMLEKWVDWLVIDTLNYLKEGYFSLSLCVYLSLSLFLSSTLYVYLYLYLSFSLSLCVSLSISLSPSSSLSLCLPVYLSFFLFKFWSCLIIPYLT